MSWFSRYIHLPICTHACLQPSNPLATRARLAAFFLAMIVIVFAAGNPATAQVGEWTWMGGIPTLTNTGVYGTLGKPDASNFPGGREKAVSWVDSKGHFWLFGGYGFTEVAGTAYFLNDLWEFRPRTHEWAWMGGSSTLNCGMECGPFGVYGTLGKPAPSNMPGAHYGSYSWTDNRGNLWFFGGYGSEDNDYGSGVLNDFWRFSPSRNEWTWMGGSDIPSNRAAAGVYGVMGTPAAENFPGARLGAVRWTDVKGNFWLFGGQGSDANGNYGYLDDLWKFDPCTGKWTWISGSSTVGGRFGIQSVYGTLGTPAAGNTPGSRYYSATWADLRGHLWLFGGQGLDANGNYVVLNDLWEFNPSTKEWSWMGGSSTVPSKTGQRGVYGATGDTAAGNLPGSRYSSVAWTDAKGHFWLFGGNGYDANGNHGELSDLWEYDPTINEWTWMTGSVLVDQTARYGTMFTPSAWNGPGGRENAVGWVDRHGDFWLFGGSGYDDSSYGNMLIDLWRYSPASSSASSELAGSDSTLTDDDATIPLNPNGKLSHDRFGRDRDEATEHDFFNFGRKSTGCSSRFEPWN